MTATPQPDARKFDCLRGVVTTISFERLFTHGAFGSGVVSKDSVACGDAGLANEMPFLASLASLEFFVFTTSIAMSFHGVRDQFEGC